MWFAALTSLLYVLPYLVSQYCWWLIILFPIACLYLIITYEYTWWQITGWIFITFGCQHAGLIYSLYTMATGHCYLKLMPGISFIGYLTVCFVGAWVVAHRVQKCMFMRNSTMLQLVAWTFIMWAVFSLLGRFCFMPCGSWQGYPFINPLLPIAEWPRLLWPIKYLGLNGTLLCFLALSATVVFVWIKKHVHGAIFSCVVYFIWFLGACGLFVSTPPAWIDRVAVYACQYLVSTDVHACLQSLSDDISSIHHRYPSVKLVIMPESALSTALVQELSQSGMALAIPLLAGGYSINRDMCFNSLVFFANGVMHSWFAKRCLVPVTEYVPWQAGMLQSLYFQRSCLLCASDMERPRIVWHEFAWVPYICSELFLSDRPDDIYMGVPIVACINDMWCAVEYVRRCMVLCARIRAIAWQRDILYASYHTAAYIAQTGQETRILQV